MGVTLLRRTALIDGMRGLFLSIILVHIFMRYRQFQFTVPKTAVGLSNFSSRIHASK